MIIFEVKCLGMLEKAIRRTDQTEMGRTEIGSKGACHEYVIHANSAKKIPSGFQIR